jgi:hypothetical protein
MDRDDASAFDDESRVPALSSTDILHQSIPQNAEKNGRKIIMYVSF